MKKKIFKSCSVDGCCKHALTRGWCGAHYKRWRKHGNPLAGGTSPGEALAFLERALIAETDECINWPFSRDAKGYGRVGILGDRGRFSPSSRVVCERAHGAPPTPKHEAAHSCGKGHEGCINPRHLRWATCAENQADKLIHGTINRGERNGHARLTQRDVREIRRRATDGETRVAMARKYGVAPTTISDIVCRRRWAWLAP